MLEQVQFPGSSAKMDWGSFLCACWQHGHLEQGGHTVTVLDVVGAPLDGHKLADQAVL